MKEFKTVEFDPAKCKSELDELESLLNGSADLSERDDLQPLFKRSEQLSAFLGTCIPNIGPANRLAFEFQIFGNYSADIVVGNYDTKTFCAIELEDGRSDSIFTKAGNKATLEWSRRFEHGFSQLVDWFFTFDSHKGTHDFTKNFGYGHIKFFGMLLIGRESALNEHEQTRLRWRSDKVSINTIEVYCRTFDDICRSLLSDWRLMQMVSQSSRIERDTEA